MSAVNHMRPTGEIVAALVAAVTAVTLVDGQTPAFERVELFDTTQIVEAFQFLLITEQRVCVIVPLDEEYETRTEGLKEIMTRRLPVGLLISDRVLGDRKAAAYGNQDTPGAYALKDLVLPAIKGQLLPNPKGVLVRPRKSSFVNVKDTEKALPMRVTLVLDVDCVGGRMESTLSAGVIY